MRGEGGEELDRLLQSRDSDELVPDRGLDLDLPRDARLALGLELHLEFSLDGRRLWEELWRGLRGRGLTWVWRLLDVDLEGSMELSLERGLRGRGLHLGLQWRLDPSRTLDLREGLVLKLHLRMNLCLDLRRRLELRPRLELDSDLLVDLSLCLGLQGLELLNLPEVLDLDLSADLSRDCGGERSLDLVSLSRARHDCGHRKTL